MGLLGVVGGLGLGCGGVVLTPILGLAAVRWEASARETVDPVTAAPGRLLDTPEGRLHVWRWGPDEPDPARPVVVLVHGSAAWSGVWEPVAVALQEAGVSTAAVDLPPFGYSERPADASYGRRDQADRIWAAVDALGLEEVVLVGHSFGAGPTMEAAMARPDRVVGVVLVAGALSLGAEPGSLGPLGWGPIPEVVTACTLTQPRAFPAGLRSMVYDDAVVTDAWVGRYTRPLSVHGTTAAVASWLPELMAPASGASLREASYRSFDRPTLLVAGAEDEVTPVAQLEAVGALLPDATLVVLPEVGHLPLVEDVDEVAGQIEGFVRSR